MTNKRRNISDKYDKVNPCMMHIQGMKSDDLLFNLPSYGMSLNHAKMLSDQPMGRLGLPADLAGLTVYLSSKASAHLTGAGEYFCQILGLFEDAFLIRLAKCSYTDRRRT